MRIRNLVGVLASAGAAYALIRVVRDFEIERSSRETHIFIPVNSDAADFSVPDEEGEEVDVIDLLEDKSPEEQEEMINDLSVKLHDDDLSPRQQKIMELVNNNPRVDTALLEEEIGGVTIRTLRRDLDTLEEKGLIRKIGKTKGSYYVGV